MVTGTSPPPLTYAMGADGEPCVLWQALCSSPSTKPVTPSMQTSWGLTNRLAGKRRLLGRARKTPQRTGRGWVGPGCLQTLFCATQADEWAKPSPGAGSPADCLQSWGNSRRECPSDILLLSCMGVVTPGNPGQSLQVVQHFQANPGSKTY